MGRGGGGGGGAKAQKNKEFDNEQKFLQLENSLPPPPYDFSNGPSLTVPEVFTRSSFTVIYKVTNYTGNIEPLTSRT